MLRRRAHLWMILAAAILASGGCRAPLGRSVPESTLAESGAYALVPGMQVPQVRGPAGCGAQALAVVLAHLDARLDAQVVADELPWQDRGANPVDLLLEARRRGFEARVASGTWDDLVEAVESKRPPIVMIDSAFEILTLTRAWPVTPMMHWGVVSGVAVDDSRLLVAAEHARHFVIDRDLFLARWESSSNCLIQVDRAGP